MPKKNRKSWFNYLFYFVGRTFVYFFKGVFFIFKGLILFFKKSKEDIKEFRKESSRPKLDATYGEFNEIKTISGEINNFNKKMLEAKSTIGLILGARGTGKSALGLRILENVKANTGKKVYALGFKKETMPAWINAIDGIEQAEANSFVLVDEGGITFSSRNAMSEMNKMLSNILLVSRHNDLSILFISQNSSNIEINTIRQADYLLLKPSSLLQKDFERKKIKDIYTEVEEDFKKLKDKVGITYIYSDQYRGFVANSLPSFWSDKVSKAFRK